MFKQGWTKLQQDFELLCKPSSRNMTANETLEMLLPTEDPQRPTLHEQWLRDQRDRVPLNEFVRMVLDWHKTKKRYAPIPVDDAEEDVLFARDVPGSNEALLPGPSPGRCTAMDVLKPIGTCIQIVASVLLIEMRDV